MANVIIGNASAITVPRQDRDSIRRFYCDVLDGKIVKEDNEKDILRLEEDFYMVFRYGDVPDESEFLRSPRALWLQIKSDNVEEMTRRILNFGVRKIDLPSGLPDSVPCLYFQAPGGQCFQLLPSNEDQAYYKGAGDGPNVVRQKEAEALKEEALIKLASRHQAGDVRKGHSGKAKVTRGYAPINDLMMYYEIEGTGDPLVFIPPAFGFSGLKSFSELVRNHSVITVDLQGNGRTADIPERPISIEQYANDVVGLLKYLKISKADFLGESYGGNTAALIAIRYPELVGRVVTYSATFAPPPNTLDPETTHYNYTPTAESSDIQFHRESYKKVAPDPDYWPKIYEKVGSIPWKGFSQEELASIKAPILIVQGDHDFVRLEHSVETVKLIPHAELAVIPDASHFALSSEQERVIPIIKHFLEKTEKRNPLATAEMGYHPGETR